MKRNYWMILLFFVFLSSLPVIIYGQQVNQLNYDEYLDLKVDLIVNDKNETNKGKIEIKIKFSINNGKQKILQVEFNPLWATDRELISIWDRGGTSSAVVEEYQRKIGNNYRPTRSDEIVEGSNIKPFFETDLTGYLNIQPPFKSGGLIFNDFSGPLLLVINPNKPNPGGTFELKFNLYYGNKKNKYDIESDLKPIKIKLALPAEDEYCKHFNKQYTETFSKSTEISKLESEFSDVSKKNEKELEQFIGQITSAKQQIRLLTELKKRIDDDPLVLVCDEVKDLSKKIDEYIKINTPVKYDDLVSRASIERDKLVKSQEALAKKQKDEEATKARPTQDKSDKKEPEKEQKDKTAPKKAQPSLTCEQFLEKTTKQVNNINEDFTNEDFTTRIENLNSEIAILNGKIKKGPLNDKLKAELNEGSSLISEKTSEINELLDEYEKHSSTILKELGTRSECKIDQLDGEMKNLKRLIEDFKEARNNIDFELQEIIKAIDVTYDKTIVDLIAYFKPKFNALLNEFISNTNSFDLLSKNFDREKNTGKYYPKDRKKLLEQLNQYNSILLQETEKFILLQTEADSTFKEKLNVQALRDSTTISCIDSINTTKNDLEYRIPKLREEISEYPTDRFPWVKIIVSIVGVIILVFGARVYYTALRRKRKGQSVNIGGPTVMPEYKRTFVSQNNDGDIEIAEPAKKPESQKVGGITITRSSPESKGKKVTEAGKGLDHVYDRVGLDYYEIDLKNIWTDTLVSKVYIHRSCIKKTYKFFYESCVSSGKVLETGGYLVGGWDYDPEDPSKYNVSLEDFIKPGDDAIYGEYQLNFGAKIGVRLEKLIQDYREKMGKEFTLTAWFHSHPEIKIFLSNHDLDVQERLSSLEHKYKLLALVIDPNTQENNIMAFQTGVFSYKSNGTMNNNQGGITLIKWKELYEWAKSPIPPDLKDYYCIELNKILASTMTSKLYLNDKSITRFSLFLDDLSNKPEATGYFKGLVFNKETDNNRWVIVNDFTEDRIDSNGDEIVGRFFCSNNIDQKIAELLAKPEEMEGTEVLMFCENHTKDLWILTRKDPTHFNLKADAGRTIPFSAIETWPTRRR